MQLKRHEPARKAYGRERRLLTQSEASSLARLPVGNDRRDSREPTVHSGLHDRILDRLLLDRNNAHPLHAIILSTTLSFSSPPVALHSEPEIYSMILDFPFITYNYIL